MTSKFTFGDWVITPHGEVGEIVGVWKVEQVWWYRLQGLSTGAEIWWSQSQLTRPSPSGSEWGYAPPPPSDSRGEDQR